MTITHNGIQDISLKPRSISHSAFMAAEERRKQKETVEDSQTAGEFVKEIGFGQSEGSLGMRL